ncbi:hypothetical protein N0V92_001638 [Colletotrichum tropicale]|nr:hypothetical protein N0V92_001638 [Colletotrichum tropicale]
MALSITRHNWRGWDLVSRHMREKYDFPVRTRVEFDSLLCKLKEDNTIRVETHNCFIIIDIAFLSASSVVILACTCITKVQENMESRGSMMTRECPKHSSYFKPNHYLEINITKDGEIPGHCCFPDRDVSGKTCGSPTLNAEYSRLRILRAALDQQFESDSIMGNQARRKLEATITTMRSRLEMHGNLAVHNSPITTGGKENLKYEEVEPETNAGLEVAQETIERLRIELDEAQKKARREIRGLKKENKTLKADFKTAKKSHSREKMQLQSEVQRVTEINHWLTTTNEDLEEDNEDLRNRNKKAEKKVKKLTAQFAEATSEAEIANEHTLQVEAELEEARQQLGDSTESLSDFVFSLKSKIRVKDDRIYELKAELAETRQNDLYVPSGDDAENSLDTSMEEPQQSDKNVQDAQQTIADLETKLEETQTALNLKTEAMTALEKRLSNDHNVTDEDTKESKESIDKQQRIYELETELATAQEALKAKEKHVHELKDAGEKVQQCRCEDKEAYVASVEEHVENLRGTMEDVLRRVSTYQGRKRRRTEGPDFEY